MCLLVWIAWRFVSSIFIFVADQFFSQLLCKSIFWKDQTNKVVWIYFAKQIEQERGKVEDVLLVAHSSEVPHSSINADAMYESHYVCMVMRAMPC